MASLDEECDITTDECQEYQTKMAQLEELLKEQQGSFAKMRKLAGEVKGEWRGVEWRAVASRLPLCCLSIAPLLPLDCPSTYFRLSLHFLGLIPPNTPIPLSPLAAIPKAVKISSVVPAKESHLTPYAASALQQAIAEAKETTAMYGATSAEAAVAWDNVEELSASDNSQALEPALSEECLVDMMDACEALEELQNKVINELGGK
jgi:hypothetical protein